MSTYLLTWNPTESSVEEIEQAWKRVCSGKQPNPVQWSCGSNKSIPLGARVFLHRQSVEPRGVVAAGWITARPFWDEHWRDEDRRKGKESLYVRWRVDGVVPGFGDDTTPEPLQAHLVADGPLHDEITWNNMPGSGIGVPEAAALELERRWALHICRTSGDVPQGEEISAVENKRFQQLVWSRSRERSLRDAKIRDAIKDAPDGRLHCEVPGCGFCFEEVYGKPGEGFAHVHHLDALNRNADEVTTTLEDLAIVCANCHAMIHRNNECRPMDGLVVKRRR